MIQTLLSQWLGILVMELTRWSVLHWLQRGPRTAGCLSLRVCLLRANEGQGTRYKINFFVSISTYEGLNIFSINLEFVPLLLDQPDDGRCGS